MSKSYSLGDQIQRNLRRMDTIITMDSNECPEVTIYTSEHDTAMIERESQTANDTNSGGYSSCSFVNEPDGALICPICTHVLREPKLTGCCGNHFCASCLKEWADVATSGPDGSCPLCREKKFTIFRDKKTERAIFELRVKCKHHLSGCTWTGALGSLDNHLKTTCPCVFLTCSNKCGCIVQRSELQSHLTDDCYLRTVSCKFCSFKGTFESITKIHNDECPMMPVECPNNCNMESILREDLPEHSELCPLEEMKCPFHIIGCEIVAARIDVQDHLEEARTVHMLNMAKHFQQVCREMMDRRMHKLKKEFEQKFDSMKKLEADIECMKSDMKCFKTHQLECDHRNNDKTDIFTKLVRQLTTELVSPKAHSNIMELHLLAHVRKSLSEPFLPVTFKMDNFEGKRLLESVWQSPSFYTEPFGYKLCLVVYPNGCCNGTGTHLSLFVHVMAGEFDHQNDWPIDVGITVEIPNQLDTKGHHRVDCSLTNDQPLHIRKKVQGSPESDAKARKGSGRSLFISHSKLNSCTLGGTGSRQYLKNNCIYFAIY